MSKKGKEKQKGKGKGGKGRATMTVALADKLTNADRAFYELSIQDAKKKILTLRAHLQNILISNDNIVEEIRQKTEGKANKSYMLQKRIDETQEKLTELKDENAKLTQNYHEVKRKTDETIQDLERKNKCMQYQLIAEIKSLLGRLNACLEYRENEDSWMIKYNELANELADKERESEEAIKEIEGKLDYENNRLKEELLNRLAIEGEEFSGSTAETQEVDFNMRLIRENIALQKNIELLTNNTAEMEFHIEEEKQLCKTYKKKIPELEKRNSELVLQCQEKLDLIKIRTKKVEALKAEYIESLTYQKQNINVMEFQICAQYRRMLLQKKVAAANQKMNAMVSEAHMYDFLTEHYKKEIEKIDSYLGNFCSTIERSLRLKEPPSKCTEEQIELLWLERHEILSVLVSWLEKDFDALDVKKTASIASVVGREKFVEFELLYKKEVPPLSSLLSIWLEFIRDEDDLRKVKSSSDIMDSRGSEVSQIIPAQRPFIANMFDVESGTSLYFSSPREDEAIEEPADGAPEQEEEQSSSEDNYGPSGETKDKEAAAQPTDTKDKEEVSQPKDTKVDTETDVNKMAPGTIVDVVYEEASEEHVPADEYVEEDEEYDMNWFY